MGFGSYSTSSRKLRATAEGYYTKSNDEIFSKSINNAMNPHGIKIRESRDSKEHPNSLPIIIGLDLTGSMGSVPNYLVKNGLPKIMEKIMQTGIKDPQILFLGVGDHEVDSAPLQVGQFESSDEFLDKWLTSVYLESGGGANAGESYLLAWYFAAFHTETDNFEKRGKKGFLFTIGDEPTLKTLPKRTLERLMGDGQYQDFTADELLEKASEKYNIYHLHIRETYSGARQKVMDDWKQTLKDNLVIIQNHEQVSDIISEIIIENSDKETSNISTKEDVEIDSSEDKIML